MKKLITALLIFLFFAVLPPAAWALPDIRAKSAVVIDAVTGLVVYGKNPETVLPPASTTKIMSALLAIEYADLDRRVTVSANAAQTGESSLNLKKGETITVRNLLYGALLKSGNDACVAMAEAVAPSEEEFVNLMNLKALAIGAAHTRFLNTNGLPQSGHAATAYDLALIARYALHNDIFAEIVGTREYAIRWDDGKRVSYLKNTNKLLWNYMYATGVKTGTTDLAGQCLVASAHKEQRDLIAVVLNSPNRFGEAQKLLEYGFEKT
ncbi:MAG: D-alanyl-D-alanine carboxypeptidase family protein [Clostridia bacterium]|nr:D-alanyl-D-alanine carboxypeptidase family protein [Clostridia bacterium]